jgi:hypothetical protein
LITKIDSKPTCKYCGSRTISKCGLYKNVRRYLCKSCGKKFKADNNLFYMRVPPEYVAASLDMFYDPEKQSNMIKYLRQQYGYSPFKSVIGQWVHKYTERACIVFKDYSPHVGDTWIISEVMFSLSGKRHRIYDILDEKTRFLLSTQIVSTRSRATIEKLMSEAERKADKTPARLSAFVNYACLDVVQKSIKYPLDHLIDRQPEVKVDIERISCCLLNSDTRQKIFGKTRSISKIEIYLRGWNISYNYFQRQSALDGKTPAEAAGIGYQLKNWKDFVVNDSQLPPEMHGPLYRTHSSISSINNSDKY